MQPVFLIFFSHLRLILNPMDSAYRCILFINRDAHTNRKENCGFGTSLIANLAFMHGRFVPVADAEAVIPSLHDATDDGMCIFFVR